MPQFLGRLQFLLALEHLADDIGARFVEIVLRVERAEVARRLAVRAADRREHVVAAALLHRAGGPESLRHNEISLRGVLLARPRTQVVDARGDDPDADYAAFVGLLDA